MVCIFGMKKGCCNSKIHTKLYIYNLVCTSSENQREKCLQIHTKSQNCKMACNQV